MLLKYIVILLVLFVLELVYFRIADRLNIVDRPSERGSSREVTLRGGGIIFYLGALLFFVISGFRFPWFILGLSIVAVLSFMDDLYSLSPKLRLPLQCVGMLFLLSSLMTGGMLHAWGGILFVLIGLIVCTGAMNVFNFMDGINGILGGYALVVLLAVVYTIQTMDISYKDSLLELGYISIIACLVFCFYNFRTKARCFAGDVGSISVAFITLFLVGAVIVHNGDLSWMAFMVVFGVDGCLTILHRMLLHEKLSQPHRKHMYQLMANELHIPHVVVSAFYMFAQACCCAWYLWMPGYITLVLQVALLSVVYMVFMRKYFYLHQEEV
jgi:UDP-N-acetylmuramyl pentapeptide phosphotransferase/UDP-N-acetylglucosamine-1-phosphate transferase